METLPIQIKLVPEDDPVLKSRANDVTDIQNEVVLVKLTMLNLMRSRRGIGLAAPQVGIPLRFFVTDFSDLEVVINPRILTRSFTRTKDREGCLSKPMFTAVVERNSSIEVEYTNVSGETIRTKLMGRKARVFQHEFDHLEGRCIF